MINRYQEVTSVIDEAIYNIQLALNEQSGDIRYIQTSATHNNIDVAIHIRVKSDNNYIQW